MPAALLATLVAFLVIVAAFLAVAIGPLAVLILAGVLWALVIVPHVIRTRKDRTHE